MCVSVSSSSWHDVYRVCVWGGGIDKVRGEEGRQGGNFGVLE